MALFDWITRNWADTDEGHHPDVTPRPVPLPPAEGVERLKAALEKLPRWRVVSADPAAGTLAATRRTAVMRFVDDVTVRFEPAAAGSVLHARSKSRLGKGDFGQNRRNLLELFAAVGRELGGS